MSSTPWNARQVHRATWIGLLAVLCWSSTIGLMRSVAEALGALGGAAVLYSVSALLVGLVQGWPSRARLRSVSRMYLLAGGLLFALYEICLSVAIGLAHDRAQSLELGMINYLWPCLTMLLAVLCRLQRARWWLWPGAAVCAWGLVLVMGDGAVSSDAGWWQRMTAHMAVNPLAYALAFAAACMWPAYSVLARWCGGGWSGVGVFLALTAALLWGQWLVAETAPMQWSWSVVLQVLAIGACTALGYGCWEYGIQRGNLAVMAAGSYFTPVLSALWASVWLAVQPGLAFWQGVVLITVGSLVCWWATRAGR